MRPIEGYEGLYSITEDGRVYAHPKTGSGGHNGMFLKPYWLPQKKRENGHSYCQVNLSKNNKKQKIFVHLLVLNAYAKKIKGKTICNHKDGNKLNNHISNLEWVNFSENIKHAYAQGLRKVSDFNKERIAKIGRERKGKPAKRKLTSQQIQEIRDFYKSGQYSSRKLAELYKVVKTTILNIVNYKYKEEHHDARIQNKTKKYDHK